MAHAVAAAELIAPDGRAAAAPASRTVSLVVEGMHCGNCIRSVEHTLSDLPGVLAARVNLSSGRVAVIAEAAHAEPDRFIAALAEIGFPARPLNETQAQPIGAYDPALLRRLGVAGFAAANIMLLSVSVWSGHAGEMPASLQTMFHWLSAIIALPAVVYAGAPFFRSARQALSAGRLNMDVPISLGVTLATAMSLFQTVRGSDQVYFDAAVTLLFFLLAGRALDQAVRTRAKSAAENLLGQRAASASVRTATGAIERVAIGDIQPGMRIVVAAGEALPVDGRVAEGTAALDESLMTGESAPRTARVGDVAHAGTVALTGPFEMDVIAPAENSLVAEIARLMQAAEQARGRYVRLADRAARLYAPMVHLLGAATFLGWLAAGAGWEAALTAAIAVLIITCPCALALAVPAVQVVATSRLFRRGIVLKAADGLERLAEVDHIVLDKTGTLTVGRPELIAGTSVSDADLATAAALAAHSRHPYAKAVVAAARQRELAPVCVDEAREMAGLGMQASVGGLAVKLGSAAFCGGAHATGDEASLYFRRGDSVPVPLPMSDPLRRDASPVLARLRRRGFGIEILSGDRPEAVESVARDTDVERFAGGQRPEQKIARLEALAREGRKVLMVGDGLNDAPSLAAAHASLSPASAADISQMAADAVFQGDALGPVADTLAIARIARRRSLQNFAIAIGYNAVFVPLAMAGQVTPLIAAIAMSASSIAVTVNALRIAAPAPELS